MSYFSKSQFCTLICCIPLRSGKNVLEKTTFLKAYTGEFCTILFSYTTLRCFNVGTIGI